MSGSYSISNPVARRINYTGSYPPARGSAPLGSAPLSSAQLISARGWWRVWWVPLCWRVNWLVTDMACQLCMLTSQLCHADVILIRVSLVGRVIWYSGRGCHSGEEDAWLACGALVRVGSLLSGACWRVQACPTSEFCTIFTSGFVSSSSTQWYGQNTILTTFIFE